LTIPPERSDPRASIGRRAAGAAAAALMLFIAAGPGPRFALTAAAQSSVAGLQRDIDRIVATAGLERATWGVLVTSLNANDTLYTVNPGKLLMPASALKVVTLAAAAERLGWNYSYETRLVADGKVGPYTWRALEEYA